MKFLVTKTKRQTLLESFAEEELQNYLQVILQSVFEEPNDLPQTTLKIQLLVKDRTAESREGYTISSHSEDSIECHEILGNSPVGLLYGVYRYLEEWGLRFSLHGDVLPTGETLRVPKNPAIEDYPVFEKRGLNTWGAHSFGLDAWSKADFRRFFAQMAKLQMNFFTLHCYPEGLHYSNTKRTPEGRAFDAEPWVWIGEESMIEENGTVNRAYPASLYNTGLHRIWGSIEPADTKKFPFGANALFPESLWSSEVMQDFAPSPKSNKDCCALFNRMGSFLAEAFEWAHALGIEVGLGIEVPLRVPERILGRVGPLTKEEKGKYYRGIFERIRRTHPLDYFWLWTPESWTWDGNSEEEYQMVVEEILIADQVLDELGRPFQLAVSGWVMGPAGNRARLHQDIPKHIPMSSLFRQMGFTPIDPSYPDFKGREIWAIPWLESDAYKGMQAIQLEAGRMLHDVKDAKDAGCRGLLGLHWRTHEVDPVVRSMARATWGNGLDEPVIESTPEARDEYSMHPREISTRSFYQDFALHEFGPEAAESIGTIFSEWDSNQIELLENGCPTNLLHDSLTTETNVFRAFRSLRKLVGELPTIEHPVHAARLDYWLGMFAQEQHLAETCFHLFTLKTKMEALEDHGSVESAVEAYAKCLNSFTQAATRLIESADSTGALGMITNLMTNPRMLPYVLSKGDELMALMNKTGLNGTDLPSPIQEYLGKPKIKVCSPPTYWPADREVSIDVSVLSEKRISEVRCIWYELNGSALERTQRLNQQSETQWRITFPASKETIAYRFEADSEGSSKLIWPQDNPVGILHRA
ncbi:MAG: hypothetical protein AAGJ81_09235 [Verrucomicrobiota bacterium]